ncbi:MAG: asparaginyl/glutamyl-tRNA amidotransferase subunit C [Campylobacteraceae bacterium 4484_166]|nr:MAG: asparaginyl/glutamyl-tRNA amidotransferase subunit C [Campylobacteraceae bacterium 4484_166]
MTINDEVINKLSKLSSIKIDDKSRESLKNELEEIVQFVENLNEVDVSNVTSTFTTIDGGTKFREDIVHLDSSIIDGIVKNSPKHQDGYFIVPNII